MKVKKKTPFSPTKTQTSFKQWTKKTLKKQPTTTNSPNIYLVSLNK